jgi:hypothetical protein
MNERYKFRFFWQELLTAAFYIAALAELWAKIAALRRWK